MTLEHIEYNPCGRTFRDTVTGRDVYKAAVRQKNVLHNGEYKPYVWDAAQRKLKYGGSELHLLPVGVQVINQGLKTFNFFFDVEVKEFGDWVKKVATAKNLTIVETERPERPFDICTISYDIECDEQVSTISIKALANDQIILKMTTKNKLGIVSEQRLKLKTSYSKKPVEILTTDILGMTPGLVIGHKFPDSDGELRWAYEEIEGRTVEVEAGDYSIALNEKAYQPGETLELSPDIYDSNPVDNDCFEQARTTFHADDTFGNLVTGTVNDFFDTAWIWNSVTVPAGATANNGCFIEGFIDAAGNAAGTGADAILKIVDARAVANWAQANRPSQQAYHGTTVNWDSNVDGDTSITSPEIKTLIQERLDDDHVLNDDIAICWYSNSEVGVNYQLCAAMEHGSLNPAELTIVYTPLPPPTTPAPTTPAPTTPAPTTSPPTTPSPTTAPPTTLPPTTPAPTTVPPTTLPPTTPAPTTPPPTTPAPTTPSPTTSPPTTPSPTTPSPTTPAPTTSPPTTPPPTTPSPTTPAPTTVPPTTFPPETKPPTSAPPTTPPPTTGPPTTAPPVELRRGHRNLGLSLRPSWW